MSLYTHTHTHTHTSHHGHVTPKMSTKGLPWCGPVVKNLCFHCRGCGHDPWPERLGPACCVAHPKEKKKKSQNDTNEHTRETETDSQTYRADLGLLGMDSRIGSLGLVICILFYVECINKVLLHSTGSYILYPVINQNRKEHEKEYISI